MHVRNLLFFLLFIPGFLTAQVYNRWSYSIEALSSADVSEMAVDAEGNVYVVGDFYSKLSVQDRKEFLSPFADHASFFLKLSADGKTRWINPLMGKRYVHMDAVTLLSDGNILISGRTDNELKLPSVSNSGARKTLSPGIFMASYTPEGDLLWAKSMATLYGAFSSLAVDRLGNFYVAGFYHYASSSRELQLPSTKGPFVEFLLKYSNTGELQWEKYMKHRLVDYNFTLKPLVRVGPDEQPVMSSVFCKTMLIDDTDSLFTSKPEDERDIYFIKWSKDGSPVWKKQLGGFSSQWLGGFDISENGDICGTGGYFREFVVKESDISSSSNAFKQKEGQGFVIFSLDKDGQLLDLHGHVEHFYLATPHANDFQLLDDGRQLIAGTFWDTIQYAKANGALMTVGGWPINNNALAGIFDEHGNLDTLWLPIFAKNGWASSTHIAVNKKHVVMSFNTFMDVLVQVNGQKKTIKSTTNGRNSLILSMEIPEKRKTEDAIFVEACSEEMVLNPLRSKQLPTRERIRAFIAGVGDAQSDLSDYASPETAAADTLGEIPNAVGVTPENQSPKQGRDRTLTPECSVFPNPTQGPFTLKVPGINGDVSMRIFSSTGCLLFAQNVRIDSVDYEQQFNLSAVASGTYLFVVEGAGLKKVFRIVKG